MARASFSRYVCGGARRNRLTLRSSGAAFFCFLDGDGIVVALGSSPVKSIISIALLIFFLLDCPGCSSDLRFLLDVDLVATLSEEAFKERN